MREKGMSPVIVIVIGLFIVVAIVYFIYTNMIGTPLYNSDETTTTQMAYESPTPMPVSESEDTSTIQSELNNTTTGSTDQDMESLELEATSL